MKGQQVVLEVYSDRVQAEVIRDGVLSTSGLLDWTLGGMSLSKQAD